ncbi:uncharacterized protein LOC143561213 [Bidens hawaiensis]|uniref:uncharacterized protein LOC143561213 n=1 Tax=Bidens hawaiensis TaxID=980011 RepID=UPI00404A8CFF
MADFLIEEEEEEEMITTKADVTKETTPKGALWNMYTDGASNEEGSGEGLILVSPEGIDLTYALRLDFPSTNNEAQYKALLTGLRMAERVKAKRVKDHVDSLLEANQVGRSYDAKDPKMMEYLRKTHELLKKFENAKVTHIPRSSNKKADALRKLATIAFNHLAKEVKVEVLRHPSIAKVTEVLEDN